MKKAVLLLVFLFPFFLFAQTNSNQGIKWTEGLTWEQIKAKAKDKNKFIFVDAYATWCVPCKKMDMEVYTDETVGDVINSKFIPVRMQMDKTAIDNEIIKAWYPVVESFNVYRIEGYPSFLFFSPDGKLAYKDVGYHDVQTFIALVKDALTDPNARYDKAISKFKSRQLPYTQMPDLARDAWYKKRDKEMAISIAKTYKSEYADKLDDNSAYTRENLYFLAEFYSNNDLSSTDRYFKFFYINPELADSIINCVRGGKPFKMVPNVITGIIRKEEISQKLYKEGKTIVGFKPDWSKIKKEIKRKYGRSYIDKLFPDEQILFYQKSKDWDNYVRYVNKKIDQIPPKEGGKLFGGQFGDAWQLNWYAWTVFENSSDKIVLEKALRWIDLSLKLEEREYAIDTKANLLYRIGKVKDAIALEKKAIELSKNDKSAMETLNKMEAGIPTWPQK